MYVYFEDILVDVLLIKNVSFGKKKHLRIGYHPTCLVQSVLTVSKQIFMCEFEPVGARDQRRFRPAGAPQFEWLVIDLFRNTRAFPNL